MAKGKKGKERLDKYYKLAREQGLRARSAFKLAQLNRRFGFLQNARSLVDLGAAPGGWLQIARKTMTVAATIIGVDLVPIRHIPGVKTICGDFLTEQCRQKIKKALDNKKADVVLHDGAPNVSGAWDKDAYVQNVLCINALKIACDHLVKDGTFVTKVFRSADYSKLMWVLTQLFTKCHVTKPESSRFTSAEIYVICVGFKAPKQIDPKFFNPRHVFAEIKVKAPEDPQKANSLTAQQILKPGALTKKAKAVGYGDEFQMKLFNAISVTDFLNHPNPLAATQEFGEITFAEDGSEDRFKNSQFTTIYVMNTCKDLRAANAFDLRKLMKWHKQVSLEEKGRMALERAEMMDEMDDDEEGGKGKKKKKSKGGDDDDDNEEDEVPSETDLEIKALEDELHQIDGQHHRLQKKKMKRVVDKKLRLATRANFDLNDQTVDTSGQGVLGDDGDDVYVSSSESDGGAKDGKEKNEESDDDESDDDDDDDGDGDADDGEDESDGEDEEELKKQKRKKGMVIDLSPHDFDRNFFVGRQKHIEGPHETGGDALLQYGENDGIIDPLANAKRGIYPSDNESGDDDDDDDESDGDRRGQKRPREDDDEGDEDDEDEPETGKETREGEYYYRMEQMIMKHQRREQQKAFQNSKVDDEDLGDDDAPDEPFTREEPDRAAESSDEEDPDEDFTDRVPKQKGEDEDFDEDEKKSVEDDDDLGRLNQIQKKMHKQVKGDGPAGVKKNKVATTGFEELPKCLRDPDSRAQVHAIAAKMLDKKEKRDLLEYSLHRHCFNDEDLPDWFVRDERKSYFRVLPITREEVQEQKARFRELDQRPAKRVMEAMNRKRLRARKLQATIIKKEKEKVGYEKSSIPSVRQLMRGVSLNKGRKGLKNKPTDSILNAEKRRNRQKAAIAAKKGGRGAKPVAMRHRKSGKVKRSKGR